MSSVIAEVKSLIPPELRRFTKEPEQVRPPDGLSTGLQAFDEKLLWRGLPQGALSLFMGRPGSGMTSLWLEAALRVNQAGKWVAWVESKHSLCGVSLWQRGFNLQKFVVVDYKETDPDERVGRLLSELFSSQLFSMIGCDLGDLRPGTHQLRKLQTLSRQHHTSLTFISNKGPSAFFRSYSVFSLVAQFDSKCISIERALHRPQSQLERRLQYGRFTSHSDSFASRTMSNSHPILRPNSLGASG